MGLGWGGVGGRAPSAVICQRVWTGQAQVRGLGGTRSLASRSLLEMEASSANVADGEVSPEEGVKVYRDALGSLGVTPIRSFDDDMVLFTPGLK